MAEPSIIILDTEPGHPIGTQIHELLGGNPSYQVELRSTPLAEGGGQVANPFPSF